jgi:hypothetical protein
VVLFGLEFRFLMAGCLAISLVTDVVTLKGYSVLTIVPLMAGLLYRGGRLAQSVRKYPSPRFTNQDWFVKEFRSSHLRDVPWFGNSNT